MERTEAELIAAALKGDAASFEPLVEKYSPRAEGPYFYQRHRPAG